MAPTNQQKAARAFAQEWQGKGYEKGESQKFWLQLLGEVLGVEHPAQVIEFEEQVHIDHTSFIDAMLPSTRVMIEQKSIGKDLRQPIRQSDGSFLTPFQQAKRYVTELPLSKHPRWIVTCNFGTFHIYDMEQPAEEPQVIELADLEKECYRLRFLVDTGAEVPDEELEVSIAAGKLVGLLYDAFLPQFKEPDSAEALRSLNILCVRLVFCLYAEDAGIFGRRNMFHDYLEDFPTQKLRVALKDLFKVLDTKPEKRDPYLADDNPKLAEFPYVNGGLFSDETAEIPPFTDALRHLLLVKASAEFDWSGISPTIFGAVFESTLNPATRRSGGMHYTSIENIHKAIDPLFLNDLKAELRGIRQTPVLKTRERLLREFQVKLSRLTFFDPACGSGNFLTETYLSLRRLENEVLRELQHGQIAFGTEGASPVMVGIGQFAGIEINDYAVTVAKTALWIAENQMLRETEGIVELHTAFLPLRTAARIVEGNALRTDWATLEGTTDVLYGGLFALPRTAEALHYDYIIGNPPFVGFTFMNAEQKKDMQVLFPGIKNIDYVCGWYKKASDLIQGTKTECCFVSTNSITQGETVARFWPSLKVSINYAYRSFVWDSESTEKAHVHCVIIGFSAASNPKQEKFICTHASSEASTKVAASNINVYLHDAPDIIVTSRNTPLCNVPKMIYGNKPADGGHLIIEDADYEDFIRREPKAKKYIRPLLGAMEFINNKRRWCLWLDEAQPNEIRQMPLVMERVRLCKEMRESSIAAGIRKFATTPTLFAQRTQPMGVDYIIVPSVSSERRRYVPMGFLTPDVICSNLALIIPSATLYHFGVLTSSVHMAWMRAVAGRLKSDYRYSKDIVYNNFVWPEASEEQQAKIEQTAQAILDARAAFPDSSLADLYDELTMPPALRKAHTENDRAVLALYGWSAGTDEADIVARLMELYQGKTTQKAK